MEQDNLLNSIIAILGSDPLHQVNRLQMYESKFHELSSLYKILEKRNTLTEKIIKKFWPDSSFRSKSQIQLLEERIQALFDERDKLSRLNSEISQRLENPEIQKEFERLEAENLRLKTENLNFKNELFSEKANFSKFQTQVKVEQITHRELEFKHNDKSKELDQLKQKLKDLKQSSKIELLETKNHLSEMEQQIQIFKIELEAKEKEILIQKEINASMDQKFIEFEKAKLAAISDLEISCLQKISAVQEEKQMLQIELSNIKIDMDSLLNEKLIIMGRIKELEDGIKKTNDTYNEEKVSLLNSIHSLELQISSVLKEKQESEKRIILREEELNAIIDSIKEENSILSRNLNDIGSTLNHESEEYSIKLDDASVRYAELDEKYVLLSKEMEQKNNTIRKLENDVITLQKEKDNQENRSLELEQKFNNLEKEIIIMESTGSESKDKNVTLLRQITELEMQLLQLKNVDAEKETLLGEISSLSGQIEQLKNMLGAKEAELGTIMAKLLEEETNKKQVEKLYISQLKILEGEYSIYKDEMYKKSQEFEAVKKKIEIEEKERHDRQISSMKRLSELEEENESLKTQSSIYQHEVQHLQELRHSDSEKQDLMRREFNETLAQCMEEISALKAELLEKEKCLKMVETSYIMQVRDLEGEYKLYKTTLESREKELSDIRQKRKTEEQRYIDSEQSAKYLVCNLQKENRNLMEKHEISLKEIDDLKAQVKITQQNFDNLRKETSDRIREYAEGEKDLRKMLKMKDSELEESIKTFKNQVQMYQEEKKAKEAQNIQLKKLEQEFSIFKNEHETSERNAKHLVSDLQKENSSLLEKNELSLKEIENLKTQITITQQNLDNLRKETSDRMRDYAEGERELREILRMKESEQQESIKTLKNQIQMYQEEKKAKEAQEMQLKQLEREYLIFKNELEVRSQTTKDLSIRLEIEKEKKSKSIGLLKSYKQRMESLESELSKKEEMITCLSEQISRFAQKITEKDVQISDMLNQFLANQEKLNNLVLKNSKKTKLLQEQENLLSKMKEMENRVSNYQALRREFEQISIDAESLKQVNINLQQEIKTLPREILNYKTRLETLETELETCKQLLNEKSIENESLKTQLINAGSSYKVNTTN